MKLGDWRDATVTRGWDNQTVVPPNTTGDYPLPTHYIKERAEYTAVLRDLLEVIDNAGLQHVNHVAYEWAKELLARE